MGDFGLTCIFSMNYCLGQVRIFSSEMVTQEIMLNVGRPGYNVLSGKVFDYETGHIDIGQ